MGVRASESSKGKLQEAPAGTARKLANPMFSGGNRKSQPPTAPRWKMGTRKEIRAVWRPAVPSWEKEFCLKATTGLFPTWDKFIEAKKYVHLYDNIMHWDDKEAQESFNRSKTLFYAKKFNILNNLETNLTLPDSDLYIDKIDWDDDSKIDDSELIKELGPGIDEEEIDEINNQTTQSKRNWEIAIEDIKPTGWDVEPEEFMNGNKLTGLIVGGHSPYWC